MNKIFIFLIIGFLSACAPTKFVKPLEKDAKVLGFNFGGPLIEFGDAKIPIPFTSIYAGYGWKEKTTLQGGLHLTSLAYKTLQLDLGVTYGILDQKNKIPGVSLGGNLNVMTSLRDGQTRIYPQIDANAYWEYGKWMSYIGTSNWIDLSKSQRISEETHQYFLPTFHIGQSIHIKKMEIGLEYKYLAPWNDNQNTVVDFVSRSSKGGNGIYLNLKRSF